MAVMRAEREDGVKIQRDDVVWVIRVESVSKHSTLPQVLFVREQ